MIFIKRIFSPQVVKGLIDVKDDGNVRVNSKLIR